MNAASKINEQKLQSFMNQAVGDMGASANAALALEAGSGVRPGKTRLRGVVIKAGFSRFRRAAATPFNLILEAPV